MAPSKNTAFVKLTTGNHGEEPSIRFNHSKNLWEINLRPSGPGVGPIFYLSEVFMDHLVRLYLTSKSSPTTLPTQPD